MASLEANFSSRIFFFFFFLLGNRKGLYNTNFKFQVISSPSLAERVRMGVGRREHACKDPTHAL